jgi:CYTH domain-containing protein
MDVDPDTALKVGWPNLKYARVERERRWLCENLPVDRIVGSSSISDLYVRKTHLRVRAARSLGSGAVVFKLTRKADIAPAKRLVTTTYLSALEYELLSQLPGDRLEKVRHSLRCPDGSCVSVDVFSGALKRLRLIELEFESDAAMEAYPSPDVAGAEVTADRRYSGAELARHGIPNGGSILEAKRR